MLLLSSLSPRNSGISYARGITIENFLKTLSFFAAILAPALPSPYSASELPRGPHPGTSHRNRTIFSPGQAEALEKGVALGWVVGQSLVRQGGSSPEAMGKGREVWALVGFWKERSVGGDRWRVGSDRERELCPFTCLCPCCVSLHLYRVPAWTVS